jgi:hypothetical protein
VTGSEDKSVRVWSPRRRHAGADDPVAGGSRARRQGRCRGNHAGRRDYRKTKGCLSRETALAMVFRLAKSAERHWRRLDGANRLGQLIEGISFHDGQAVQDVEEQAAA